MDIEELSKSQMVLLTIFVSFITSITSGIATVALVSQSTPTVAQTVNRVIQQTIEEASAPAKSSVASVAVSTPVKSVVVVSDASSQAVAKATPSIVRLFSSDGSTFLGFGVVIDSSGTIVSDMAALPDMPSVSVERSDGSSATATVVLRDSLNELAFLSPATSSLATSTLSWSPAVLAASPPTLAQNVIAFAGKSATRVAPGIVTQLVAAGQDTPTLAQTTISGDNLAYGSPFIDSAGELVGISTAASRENSDGAFIPASSIIAESTQGTHAGSAKETGLSGQ